MRIKTLWLLLAMLVASLALIAAGCGGDDDGGDAAGTGTTQEEEEGGGEAADQTISVNWGTEPPSLDPGLASDTTSANIVYNIMDPLIKLDEDLNPVPNLAESFETSEDGLTVTITLRDDGAWSNGDPVTAEDFEWSWKRTISPELAADYAYQFYGIEGAQEYNGCEKKNCDALADKVGVNAVDDRTLEIKLTSPQPWFTQQLAHHSFMAVHRPTVEQFGDKWTEAANIVTNGPFLLDSWEHNANINLVKNEDWRAADEVTLTRVDGRMITDGTTAVQAFEAGEVDVTGGLPVEEIPRLKETEDYQQYPALGTYYYGFNVKTITDVNQRRAMSLAIDRQSIIDNVAQADQLPTTGFTPKGMPGFDQINPDSPWEPPTADLEQAKTLMEQVDNPKTDINLLLNDAPGHREIAVAVQAQWKELGLNVSIKQQEWAQFLEFIGPPPDPSIDVFRLGWIGDFVDAMNFLELWTSESGNNSTNFASEEYDSVIEEARQTPDNDARYELYAQAEEILGGEDGQMPIMPIYWYTFTQLERPTVQETYNLNLLDQVDLTQVVVQES
jgi:oligopeptide transport system substrate-binding protein